MANLMLVDSDDVDGVIRRVAEALRASGDAIACVYAVQAPTDRLEAIASAPDPLAVLPRRGGRRTVDGIPVRGFVLRDHPRKGGRCAWYSVEGQRVQGTLERRYAEALTRQGIRWLAHHRRTFLWQDAAGAAHWYQPDFYLPDTASWVEVKGFWREADRDKMARVQAQHPAARIQIVTEREVRALE